MRAVNETDVREEIAAPLLAALGYRRGTENDILREFTLSYDHAFLGRKKKNDPPLRGRADYVLSVLGSGRWILEIKAPGEAIDQAAIEQAMSYARHPEVSAAYAAILNGQRIVIYHSSQRSVEKPIVDLEVSSVGGLTANLQSLLTPAAIRRDCAPRIVDLNMPLASGLRSTARILRGSISYSNFTWDSNFPLPEIARPRLDEMCRRMRGWRSNITGGDIWRDNTSRIRAKLDWTAPHDEILKFAYDKKLLDVEYVSLSSIISDDASAPTMFDVIGKVVVTKGEKLFDILRWDTQVVGIDASMNYRGQAVGSIGNESFSGHFQAEYETIFPVMPDFELSMFGIGTFEVVVDPR